MNRTNYSNMLVLNALIKKDAIHLDSVSYMQ